MYFVMYELNFVPLFTLLDFSCSGELADEALYPFTQVTDEWIKSYWTEYWPPWGAPVAAGLQLDTIATDPSCLSIIENNQVA